MKKKLTRMLTLPAWAFEADELRALRLKISNVINDLDTSPALPEEQKALSAIDDELAFRGKKLLDQRERFIAKFGTD